MSNKIIISDECINKYNELDKSTYSAIFYKLNGDFTSLIFEKYLSNEKSYNDFINELPPSDCRFILYNFHFNQDVYKQLFIFWQPEHAKVKSKMLYTSIKESMRKKFKEIKEFHASDYMEIEYQYALSLLK